MQMDKNTQAHFEKHVHRNLLLSFLAIILITPFILSLGKFEWVLSVLMLPVILTAVRTISKKTTSYCIRPGVGHIFHCRPHRSHFW